MGLFKSSKLDIVRNETRRNQAAAADPATSAWVSANAGTGKTHVLTMRVLRLLLAGTPPERILALTYTKAAAAEMSKRVFDAAGRMGDAARRRARRASSPSCSTGRRRWDEMQRARQLFAIAIETPGGLKVQTIHAFCERLLQRFPLEAGVPPGFAILDDQERSALLREAVDEMLAEATADARSPLAKALEIGRRLMPPTAISISCCPARCASRTGWRRPCASTMTSDDSFVEAEKIYRKALGLGSDVPHGGYRCGSSTALLSDAELTRGARRAGLGLAPTT